MKTDVGANFLKIVKECIPSNHKFHKICNRNTLKLNNNRSEETYTGCSVNLKKCFGKQKRSVRVLEENQTIKHCTDCE